MQIMPLALYSLHAVITISKLQPDTVKNGWRKMLTWENLNTTSRIIHLD